MAILNENTTVGGIPVEPGLIKNISISSIDELDTIVEEGIYYITENAISYILVVVRSWYTPSSNDCGRYQYIFGSTPSIPGDEYHNYDIHKREGTGVINGNFSWGTEWKHFSSSQENMRYTSWSNLPPVSGSYRVYASSGAPSSSYSTWAVTQFEAGASTDNPSTKCFIQIAMLGSNNVALTTSDLWYRKCRHNGSSWTNGIWKKIFADNGSITVSSTVRTSTTVTNSTSTGYFRNIKVGTSAPSTLTSGEIFLVYEP